MDFCLIERHIFLAKTVFGKLQFVQVKHYFFGFLIKLSIDCLSHSAMLSSGVCLVVLYKLGSYTIASPEFTMYPKLALN